MGSAPTPDEVIRQADHMAADRSTFDNHWREVRDHENPEGDSFVEQTTPGVKSRQKVFDNTAEQAGEQLASALFGLMTNPATDWFKIRTEDDRLNRNREVSVWLEDAAKRMLEVFRSPRRGFQVSQHEQNIEMAFYGNGAKFIDDRPGYGPTFRSRPIKEMYFAEDDEGRIDTVVRRWAMPARAAVKRFGNAAGEKVIEAANSPDRAYERFRFIHLTEPRRDRDPTKLDSGNLPYASVVVGVDHKALIEVSGYREMPWITPRWIKRADECYGRGPGMKALPDAKMLQRAMKATIRGTEKIVDPPLQVADDGVMSSIRLTSGGITTVRSDLMQFPGGGIRPIVTGARPDLGEQFMQSVRDRIMAAFFAHLIRLSQDPRMTATQVLQLAETTKIQMGPMFGRFESEDLGPTIDRTFAVMWRRGMFAPPPEVLSEARLVIEYVSPIARAQRLVVARALHQTLDLVDRIYPYDRAVVDNFDFDEAVRDAAEALGWPRNAMRADDVIAAIRAERNKMVEQDAQRQAQNEDALTAAKVLPAAVKAAGGGLAEAA